MANRKGGTRGKGGTKGKGGIRRKGGSGTKVKRRSKFFEEKKTQRRRRVKQARGSPVIPFPGDNSPKRRSRSRSLSPASKRAQNQRILEAEQTGRFHDPFD